MNSRQRVAVFKALGHRVRLAVVDRLGLGECCVGALRKLPELAGLSGPTVSQHLLVLKAAGLITDAKRGTRVYYRVMRSCVAGMSRWADELEARAKS